MSNMTMIAIFASFFVIIDDAQIKQANIKIVINLNIRLDDSTPIHSETFDIRTSDNAATLSPISFMIVFASIFLFSKNLKIKKNNKIYLLRQQLL